MQAPASRKLMIWGIFGLIALTVLTYVRGISNAFVAEDFFTLTELHISSSALVQQFSETARPRPVWVTFMWVLRQVFDANPTGYHIVLIILHVTAVILVLLVTYSLSKSQIAAFLAAILFALYPRDHQPVLWYSANQFILTTVFALICIYGLHRYLVTHSKRWYIVQLVGLILALMSQESGVILFVLLPLMDILLIVGVRQWKNCLKRDFWGKYIPLLGVAVLYFLMTFSGSRLSKLTGGEISTSADPQLAHALQSEDYHFSKLDFTSVESMVGYLTYGLFPHIPLRSLDATSPIGLLLAGSTLVILAVLFVTQSNLVRFMLLWFILGFVPYVLFVPFGNADRYFYLPSVGICIGVAVTLHRLYQRALQWRPQIARIGLGTVMGVYLVVSVIYLQQRIDEWHTSGEIAAGLVDQAIQLAPNPAPDSTILFVDPPKEYGQAYLLGTGITAAVTLHYEKQGIKVSAYQTSDAGVVNSLLDAQPVDKPLDKTYIFVYENGVFIDKSNTVTDIEKLNPGSWFG